MRFFNTTGPVNRNEHYCLPPLDRFDPDEIINLIEQKKYFMLHGPGQTGKTTFMIALMERLNSTGNYSCLYCNVGSSRTANENVFRGIRAILSEMAARARHCLKDDSIHNIHKDILEQNGEDYAINEVLTQWCLGSKKSVVLLIDGIDSLADDTLISLLSQLRAGYDTRPSMFPQSIFLCGMRDIKKISIHSDKKKNDASCSDAFNIKMVSMKLGDFTIEEVKKLYRYHSRETGQNFSKDVINIVWNISQGQPWLVNAIGYELTFKMKQNRDRTVPITTEMAEKACENLIKRRATHIDQAASKLYEERVQQIIEPVIAGNDEPGNMNEDDLLYAQSLGLIKIDGNIRIANRFYMEIIPQILAWPVQVSINQESDLYIHKEDGSLDVEKMLFAFQKFFCRHSEKWSRNFQYKEAAPQLLMHAFVSRIMNNCGRIYSEYGLGRKRTDLLLVWPSKNKKQEVVIELKIRDDDTQKTIARGLRQTWEYMEKCGTKHGHLVIFDRRENVSLEDRVFHRVETYEEHYIIVWGM